MFFDLTFICDFLKQKTANDFKFLLNIIKIQQLEIWPLNCWWLQGNRNDMEWLLLCVWVMFDESFYRLSFFIPSLSPSLSFSSISAGVSLYFFISLFFNSSSMIYFLKQVENCEIVLFSFFFVICTLVVHLFLLLLMDPIATEINISRIVFRRRKQEKDETHILFFMKW